MAVAVAMAIVVAMVMTMLMTVIVTVLLLRRRRSHLQLKVGAKLLSKPLLAQSLDLFRCDRVASLGPLLTARATNLSINSLQLTLDDLGIGSLLSRLYEPVC